MNDLNVVLEQFVSDYPCENSASKWATSPRRSPWHAVALSIDRRFIGAGGASLRLRIWLSMTRRSTDRRGEVQITLNLANVSIYLSGFERDRQLLLPQLTDPAQVFATIRTK